MSIKGKAGCTICGGSGYAPGDWGTQVLCKCVIELMNEADEQAELIEKPAQELKTVGDLYLRKLLEDKVITEDDVELEYSREYTLRSLADRCEALHLKISKQAVMGCLDVMDGIIGQLRLGILPNKSYAIGAENGIGKTTFAITAIKVAAEHGLKVVPYADMSTLAEKYIDYSKNMRQLQYSANNGLKFEQPEETEKHTWRDYVEADFVIVSLTGGNADIAYVELDTLLTLVSRRAAKRKPTIVLMRTSVNFYAKFDDVRKYFIKELFAMSGKQGSYGMFECYSMFTKEPTEVV